MKIDFAKCYLYLLKGGQPPRRLVETTLGYDGKMEIGELISQTSIEPLLFFEDGDTVVFAYKEFGDPDDYAEEDAVIKINNCEIIRALVKLDTAGEPNDFFVRVSFSGAFTWAGKQ